jgi:hypothetical protein
MIQAQRVEIGGLQCAQGQPHYFRLLKGQSDDGSSQIMFTVCAAPAHGGKEECLNLIMLMSGLPQAPGLSANYN